MTVTGTPLPHGSAIMHVDYFATPGTSPKPAQHSALSAQQVQVLRMLAEGQLNGQIAARLGVSVNTVDKHTHSIYSALGVCWTEQPRVAAVTCGFRRGLLR